MRTRKQEFPHPILSDYSSDYVTGAFTVSDPDVETTTENFVIKCRYDLTSSGLSNLIRDNRAQVIVRFYSYATAFRTLTYFNNDQSLKFSIPKVDVAKSIEATAYVVATSPIPNFSLSEFNPEYFAGLQFLIRKGDILVESVPVSIKLDDSELQKPLSSIFIIARGDGLNGSMYLDFYSDKIKIELKPEMYEIYARLRKGTSLRRYLSAVIVFPALVNALSLMKNLSVEDELTTELRWYRSIESKLNILDIDLYQTNKPLTSIANELLGDIGMDSLKNLKELIDNINTSETLELE